MSRTYLKSLILLNWKGLFYHRFDLHERVTALEGQNGAGKTTVMIAAYVALLPDLSKLRFTNVGEHGATGGDRGIYGRLGEPGRPTYTVLEVCLPEGTRLLCGVQLVRKSAPSLELNPFIITGLSWQVALEDLLLERSSEVDAVPELDGLRQNAARLGGKLVTFGSAKDYFAALFDYGVTPLRLVSEDERDKFNEVLRTSMVGGISRALGGELRSFLLKEEVGLADSLKQMRANLDTCRKTRSEVKEAEEIEAKIHAVLEAGQEMFAAAIHAVRTRAVELRKAWDEARLQYDLTYERSEELKQQVARSSEAYERADRAYQDSKEQQLDVRKEVDCLRRRCALDERIYAQQQGRDRQRARAATAQQGQQLADAELLRCAEGERSAADSVTRAAAGLADLRQGMEELASRSAAYHLATAALSRVRLTLSPAPVDLAQLAQLERTCQKQIFDLDEQSVKLDRRIEQAAHHAAAYARTASALSALCAEFFGPGAGVAVPESRREQAQQVLRKLRELDASVEQVPRLTSELDAARRQASEQRQALADAAALATPELGLSRRLDVFAAHEQAEAQQAGCDQKLRELESEQRAVADSARTARSRLQVLEEDARRFRQAQAQASQLSKSWQQPLRSSREVDDLRIRLDEQLRLTQREIHDAEGEQKGIQDELWSTEQSGCLPEVLRRACSQVDGELLVERFEDIAVEDAGRIQAQLGPLYEAILVDEVAAAAAQLTTLDPRHRPETVWLIERDTDLQPLLESQPLASQARDILVRSPRGHRLTQIPERPVLGSRARRQRVGELRKKEQRVGDRLGELRATAEGLQAGLTQVAELLRLSSVLDRGDPSDEIERARLVVQEADEALPGLQSRIREEQGRAQALTLRRKRLLTLCEKAHLLDLPNQQEAAESIRRQIASAQQTGQRLQQLAGPRQLVESELETLRTEPLSVPEREQLVADQQQLEGARDRQAHLLRDLRHLIENRSALGWADAAAALQQQTVEREMLDAQLAQAQKDHAAAKQAEAHARQQALAAAALALKAASELERMDSDLRELVAEHEALGGAGETAATAAERLGALQARYCELERLAPELEERKNRLLQETATLQEKRRQKEEELDGLRENVGKAERAARPEQERCERIERRAEEAGILHSALTERYTSKFTGQGAVNLWSIATEQRARLCERLRQIRDGGELARQVDAASTEQGAGETAMEAWLRVRNFLLRCIPAQIAEANDPEVALGRLRDHLRQLGHRLSQQEERLRGNSQDVAHNIEGLVRRARKQVSRLNQDLAMVRFGSIIGVRIKVVSVERMERVLHALKEGAVQTLLFHTEMPLEEALEEIFRTYGGGKSGGNKLLDFREYLELVVEVRRQVSPDWEPANATKLSTGEAIGVGAAVMMVILTAWERDANLLRTKRSAGTMRLLFLDEANRLSRDSLDILFDLCDGLELQLLIAAPEVANAEGNITHTLVRVVEQGREEVRASARQVIPRKDDGAAVHVA
jgi:chromosome partition protein MukB